MIDMFAFQLNKCFCKTITKLSQHFIAFDNLVSIGSNEVNRYHLSAYHNPPQKKRGKNEKKKTRKCGRIVSHRICLHGVGWRHVWPHGNNISTQFTDGVNLEALETLRCSTPEEVCTPHEQCHYGSARDQAPRQFIALVHKPNLGALSVWPPRLEPSSDFIVNTPFSSRTWEYILSIQAQFVVKSLIGAHLNFTGTIKLWTRAVD